MKFVLAPDSFKESMSAKEVCIAMEKGIKKVFKYAECVHVPMADGGEGTISSLVDATGGKIYTKEVVAPLGNKVVAKFGILGDKKTGIIEMAEASGLHLVHREKRNPLITTTYGTGELIKEVLDKGVENIIIGLGGSATNDGGAGMLQALGAKLLDNKGNEIIFGGGSLGLLAKVDLINFDKRILNVAIEVACDVKNPLTGIEGASNVFGPQKGATKDMVEILDSNLKNFAQVVKNQFKIEIDKVEGAGAAGGLGATLAGFCNAKLSKGIDIVMKYSNLEEKLKGSNYVFTGEGSVDSQTKFGKTPVGVSMLAKKYNIPVIVLAGKVGTEIEELYKLGITAIIGILPGVVTLEEALLNGKINIEKTTENISRILKIK
ncbi:glycerate kinase [Clostridium gasigenes]|uniref:glycerate kinase family protein n=1 Tax=Clostridium gasigenes TaxID=94869 RepID=UPI001C0E73E3|nr:glycerate kinase [Clostridium gasigenes]MBU3134446.1 glycerate kinase [Clostridium gasigenes]